MMPSNQADIVMKSGLQVDKELLENISHLLEIKADKSILNILRDLHPADIAEIINNLNLDDAKELFSLLDTETASDVLPELDENQREYIFKNIDKKTITDIVDELETDDATDIVSELPDSIAEHVLDNIDKEDSEDVKELLKYPEDTAGGIMTSDFVFVHESGTVKDAIKEVRKHAEEFDQIYHIYVLTDDNKLVGIVQLKSLLTNPLHKRIKSIMEKDLIFVTPDMDQEEVANIMDKYDLVAIPVVDKNRVMLGRITIDDIVEVIQEEASEDLQKIAGLSEDQESTDSIFQISRIRLPWLLMVLILEIINGLLLSSFQATIQQQITATFFIPVIMAIGGSSGNQAAVVMVRSLALGEVLHSKTLKILLKELGVSLLNGIASAGVILIATQLLFSKAQVSFSFSILLSCTLLIIISYATIFGAAIPLILKKLGIDPAVAASPLVSTANDIFGLLIYFSLVTLFYSA